MRIAILTGTLILLIIFITYLLFPESGLADFMTYIWIKYSQSNTPIVGIFTGMGAIFTVCVFYTTHKSTKNTEISLKIARESLKLSMESSKKDDFIRQFTLLIEQHNKSHEIMMRNLDDYRIGDDDNIKWGMTLKEASDKLYLNHKFSPYMRMLFRVLKHCDENFYMQGNTDEVIREKKKYTSIVRSMIRNDVLYFVAINSMNNNPTFDDYRKNLNEFNFFEHLIPDSISDSIKFSVDDFYGSNIYALSEPANTISLFIKKIINFELERIINERIKFDKFHPTRLTTNNNTNDIPYSFNYKIAFLYVKYKYKSFLTNIENIIDYDYEFETAWRINPVLSSDMPIINKKYYIYVKDESISSGYRRLENHEYTIENISKTIIDSNLSVDDLNNKIIEETTYPDFNISTDKIINYIDIGSFISIDKIYNECKKLIQLKVRDSLVSEKKLIFSKIMNLTIDKMNETSLIKESGEKLITYDGIKIVFEINESAHKSMQKPPKNA